MSELTTKLTRASALCALAFLTLTGVANAADATTSGAAAARPATGNPDPAKWVGYGDRTVDEMAHVWVNVTNISDSEYNEWAAKHQNSDLVVNADSGRRPF